MKRKWCIGTLSAMGMLVLILDSKTAAIGAREGLALCMNAVIPALLPFIFLSQLLISALMGTSNPLFSVAERILKIPRGSGCIYIAGLLGGYPTGAQLVSQAYRDGALNNKTAQRLLSFCSNAGPSFLFGILSGAFSNILHVWCIWVIQILSNILVSRIIADPNTESVTIQTGNAVSPVVALKRSLFVMGQICGWVILFRVLTVFFQRWFLFALPLTGQICVNGLFELTAGCVGLYSISNEGLRMILCSAFLSFGGLCVTMQTISLSGALKIRSYISGRVLQCLISTFLTAILQYFILHRQEITPLSIAFWSVWVIIAVVFSIMLRRSEKNSSISSENGVQLVA